MTGLKKLSPLAIKISMVMGLGFGFLTHAYALVGGVGLTVLAGGSVMNFDKQGHVVFPAGSFRQDSFKYGGGGNINFAPAAGVSYDVVIGPNKYNPWYLFRDISLGVNVYYNQTSRSGSVYEYSLPDFNNSTYSMNVKSGRLMLDTEWDIHPLWYNVIPFVEAGLGVAQNTMSFKNKPRPNIGAGGGNYNLDDHSKIQFAYEIGAGVKLPVSDHFVVSARYLFANAGDAESGTSDNDTGVLLAKPIKTSVESQSVLLGLSYFFG